MRSVACREHNDHRERQVVFVLLVREPAVYGEQRIESTIRSEAKQRTVASAGPSISGTVRTS